MVPSLCSNGVPPLHGCVWVGECSKWLVRMEGKYCTVHLPLKQPIEEYTNVQYTVNTCPQPSCQIGPIAKMANVLPDWLYSTWPSRSTASKWAMQGTFKSQRIHFRIGVLYPLWQVCKAKQKSNIDSANGCSIQKKQTLKTFYRYTGKKNRTRYSNASMAVLFE